MPIIENYIKNRLGASHTEAFFTGTKNDDDLESGCSLKGRIFCLGKIFWHTAGIVYKPVEVITFLALNILITPFAIATADNKKMETCSRFTDSLVLMVGIFIAPTAQYIKVIRAALGVIHPGAYYSASYSKIPEIPAEAPRSNIPVYKGKFTKLYDVLSGKDEPPQNIYINYDKIIFHLENAQHLEYSKHSIQKQNSYALLNKYLEGIEKAIKDKSIHQDTLIRFKNEFRDAVNACESRPIEVAENIYNSICIPKDPTAAYLSGIQQMKVMALTVEYPMIHDLNAAKRLIGDRIGIDTQAARNDDYHHLVYASQDQVLARFNGAYSTGLADYATTIFNGDGQNELRVRTMMYLTAKVEEMMETFDPSNVDDKSPLLQRELKKYLSANKNDPDGMFFVANHLLIDAHESSNKNEVKNRFNDIGIRILVDDERQRLEKSKPSLTP